MQRLKGLSKSEVDGFFDWLQDYWYWLEEYQKFASEVSRCAEEINRLLDAGYLRRSRWLKIRAMAQEMLDQFRKVPAVGYLDHDRHADFTLVQQMAHWTERDVEDHRVRYVDCFKEQFADYFDRVESNPPDREPARCLCDRRRQ